MLIFKSHGCSFIFFPKWVGWYFKPFPWFEVSRVFGRLWHYYYCSQGKENVFCVFFLPFLNKFSSLKGVAGDVATKENMYIKMYGHFNLTKSQTPKAGLPPEH